MSDRTQALQPALDPRILDHLGHKLRWELAARARRGAAHQARAAARPHGARDPD